MANTYFQNGEKEVGREQVEFALVFYRFNPSIRNLPTEEVYKVLTKHWQDYCTSEFKNANGCTTYECCYDYISNYCSHYG